MLSTDGASPQREKWLAAGALAVFMTLVFRNGWVTEDAYLTLRTIDNWFHGYGLRWNVDERVQAYTHPLWLMVLTLHYLVFGHAYVSALVSGLLVSLLSAVALVRLARSSGHAVTALALLALSRSVVDFSTAGLENPLSHVLLALLVWLYAVREARVLWLALCAGLLALNRMDAMLVALLPLAHTCILSYRERGPKQTLKELALGFSPYLAWELFSLVYYGFLVPNTAFAKLNTGHAREQLFSQGVVYVVHTMVWDPVLLAILLIGLTFCIVKRERRTTVLALSMLINVVYVLQIGGDFMKGRFLTIPVYLASCLVAISSLPLQQLSSVATILLPILVLFLHPSATDLHHAYTGEEDEREYYEGQLALTAFNRHIAEPIHRFRDEGEEMKDHAVALPVREAYNVGLTGYFAGPKVHIIDINALADPLLARLPARYDPNWRIGHYTRAVPPGYAETIRTGKCEMKDPSLCEYYAHLREIIAGDIWSWSRFKTIAIMNTGGYQKLIDVDKYRYPDLQHTPIAPLLVELPEGSAWNDPRAQRVPTDGLDVVLEAPSHAKNIELLLDGNDAYDLTFKLGPSGPTIHSEPSGKVQMRTRSLDIPAEATKAGFDHILVRPLRGDSMYALGYIRLH